MSYLAAASLVVFGSVIGAFGALLFKLAANKGLQTGKAMFLTIEFISGGFLYFISTIPFLIAIKFADITSLYPLVATSYIWVIVISKFFLNEKINLWKIAGILFIIMGVIFTGLGKT